MKQRHIQLASGVELLMVHTNQFKTGLFSVTLTVPLRKETVTANALLTDVLYRGSRLHPDIASLSAATDDLYGAALEVGVRQRGETQCICLQCSFIDDVYALDGTAIL
ncbi:MAG: insulinase family protein, partial [Clostridia bacterium]|nr:insulinase family protein [Clostridia bacterium]